MIIARRLPFDRFSGKLRHRATASEAVGGARAALEATKRLRRLPLCHVRSAPQCVRSRTVHFLQSRHGSDEALPSRICAPRSASINGRVNGNIGALHA